MQGILSGITISQIVVFPKLQLTQIKVLGIPVYLLSITLSVLFIITHAAGQKFQSAQRLAWINKLKEIKAPDPGFENSRLKLAEIYKDDCMVDSSLKYYQGIFEGRLKNVKGTNLDFHIVYPLAWQLRRKTDYMKANEVLIYHKPGRQVIGLREDVIAEHTQYYNLYNSCKLNTGNMTEALTEGWANLKRAEKLSGRYNADKARAYLNWANIIGFQSFVPEVETAFRTADSLARLTTDNLLMTDCAIGMYYLSRSIGDKNLETASLARAYNLALTVPDSVSLLDVLQIQYHLFADRGNSVMAENVLQRMEHLARKYNYPIFLGYAYEMKANLAQAEKNYPRFYSLFDSSLKYFVRTGKQPHLATTKFKKVYNVLKNGESYDLAIKLMEPAFQERLTYELQVGSIHTIRLQLLAEDRHKAQEELLNWVAKLRLVNYGLVSVLLISLAGLFYFYKKQQHNKKAQQQLQASNRELEKEVQLLGLKLNQQQLVQAVITSEAEKASVEKDLDKAKTDIERKDKLLKEIEAAIQSAPKMSSYLENLMGALTVDSNEPENDWEKLLKQFEIIRPTFFRKLQKKGPELSALDQKICAFMVMNLGTKTIAQMLNVTEASLLNRRSGIRRKLGLERGEDLDAYLMQL